MKDKIRKCVNGQKMCSALLGAAIGFMFCIFAPLDIFFANKDEFWFSLQHLLPVLVITFLIFTAIFSIIMLFVQATKAATYIYGFLLYTYLYFYVQGNYIPRDYGVLNGTEIDWSSYVGYGIASIVLALICVLLCVFSLVKLKDKIYSFGKYLCIFIVLIQAVTVGVVWLQNRVSDTDSTPEKFVVTNKDLLNLSENENIIIFILDTFDSRDMLNLLDGEDAEEYQELFRGFTYYPDTLGLYPTTKGALPHILTGEVYYNNKPWKEYVQETYINNTLYETLRANDFSIGVYTEDKFLNKVTKMYANVDTGEYYVNDNCLFASKIFELVAFNYMPHQLKRYFNLDTGEFDQLKGTISDGGAYSADVQGNYAYLVENGISVSGRGNCFRLYHTEGVHAHYTFGKNLISEPGATYSVYDEAEGNCTFLKTYFDQMKEKGIYDNSTIIVMADHGHYDYSQNPLFMIKNAGDTDEFSVSEEKMSFEYLHNILVFLVNGERVTEEYIRDCGEGKERYYLYYTWDDSWDSDYLPKLQEMYVDGYAGDVDNLHMTGKEYLGKDAPSDE